MVKLLWAFSRDWVANVTRVEAATVRRAFTQLSSYGSDSGC